jgi:histone demethylase JARID1
MIFSTFAWHIEDHHLYSVNYMHHGASKKWYGIRGKDSEVFEDAMRSHLPDAFDREPDLHYQLVTMVPPGVFLEQGIQVCTLTQNPGEFVFTFPGAYHGGFNHGVIATLVFIFLTLCPTVQLCGVN